MPPTMPPGQEMDQGSPMGGRSQFDPDELNKLGRPSHEDEDVEVIKGIQALTEMTRQLIQTVQSGPVEDVLVSIMSKLVSLAKKYDQSIAQAQEGP
jgi:hypothetical protein